jgi:predicted PolB exonuclease-like 3'-5' exonuclease
MRRVVFDIETVGIDFDQLSESQKEYLTKWAKDDEEVITAKQSTAFYPLTGFVCAIGFFSPDAKEVKGTYFLDPQKEEVIKEGDIIYRSYKSEEQLLNHFWPLINNFSQVITFNGRVFDVPFLLIRSAINKVRATKDLMGYRFEKQNQKHIDLADQLSFQGAMKRKFSLEFYCQAFNIQNPKEKMHGVEVSKLFNDQAYLEIAKYCYGDVGATYKLYEYWENYINISSNLC